MRKKAHNVAHYSNNWLRNNMSKELTSTERLVLLIVASYADADGKNAFPSVKTIAEQAGVSTRTVQRALKRLRELKQIELIDDDRSQSLFPKSKRPNTYRVLVGKHSSGSVEAPQKSDLRGDMGVTSERVTPPKKVTFESLGMRVWGDIGVTQPINTLEDNYSLTVRTYLLRVFSSSYLVLETRDLRITHPAGDNDSTVMVNRGTSAFTENLSGWDGSPQVSSITENLPVVETNHNTPLTEEVFETMYDIDPYAGLIEFYSRPENLPEEPQNQFSEPQTTPVEQSPTETTTGRENPNGGFSWVLPEVGANPGDRKINHTAIMEPEPKRPPTISEKIFGGDFTGWKPSDKTLNEVRKAVNILDIRLSVLKYSKWCEAKKRTPNESEWASWAMRDEEESQRRCREEALKNERPRKWYSVAD